MNPTPRVSLAAAALMLALSGSACVLNPETIGVTLSSSTSGASPGSTGEGEDESLTDSTSNSSSSGEVQASGYGEPCELVGITPDIQVSALSPQEACEGGICLFAYDDTPPTCSEDAGCLGKPPYVSCDDDNGLCVIDPEVVDELAHCTQACEEDAECPAVPGCETGVACLPFSTLGSLCCQKVCTCIDNVDVAAAEGRALECEQDLLCD